MTLPIRITIADVDYRVETSEGGGLYLVGPRGGQHLLSKKSTIYGTGLATPRLPRMLFSTDLSKAVETRGPKSGEPVDIKPAYAYEVPAALSTAVAVSEVAAATPEITAAEAALRVRFHLVTLGVPGADALLAAVMLDSWASFSRTCHRLAETHPREVLEALAINALRDNRSLTSAEVQL